MVIFYHYTILAAYTYLSIVCNSDKNIIIEGAKMRQYQPGLYSERHLRSCTGEGADYEGKPRLGEACAADGTLDEA